MDQLPPGLTAPSQANLFQGQGQSQGQGHSRQHSRFSFANDSAGTTSVKLTANPRIMAQQSAMMPQSLHSQSSGGLYYTPTSVSGPPPGLKSTGTPPNMFGTQGHSFGTAPFGRKDSQLLQDMLRDRNGGGSFHDTGKREYHSPSFSHQFPPSTSSSPAPAPGFSALLYGNQPGAFQDLGLKQKKKGKKHRHANTSSSGGGGIVVDLADPGILQARMSHQQSNAGVGQGLFGGQNQGGYNPMMQHSGVPRW